jgi:hypothetical protein
MMMGTNFFVTTFFVEKAFIRWCIVDVGIFIYFVIRFCERVIDVDVMEGCFDLDIDISYFEIDILESVVIYAKLCFYFY